MNIFDYILIAIITLWLITSTIFIIKQKKKGNHIACGNCNRCSKNCNTCKNKNLK